MKKIGLILTTLALAVTSLVFATQAVTTQAAGRDDVCAGLDAAVGTAGTCGASTGGQTVEGTVAQVIRIFSYVVGVISVIMVIVGGFQYVTSGGDSGKVTTAKNTIMYALIGVVIVVLAQVMVRFVIDKVPG